MRCRPSSTQRASIRLLVAGVAVALVAKSGLAQELATEATPPEPAARGAKVASPSPAAAPAALPATGAPALPPAGATAAPTASVPPAEGPAILRSPRAPATPFSNRAPAARDAAFGAKAPKLEIASEDGAHRVAFSALVQSDARLFLADSGRSAFAIRRARPILDARVYRYFELKLQADFSNGKPTLFDAYGNVHFLDEIQLLAGKARTPVGLERLQSARDLSFAERSFATALVPNRDIGVKLYGTLLGGTVEWAASVTNGVPNGQSADADTNDAKNVAARLFVLPFRPLEVAALEGLGLGFSVLTGNEQGPLPSYFSSGLQPYFSYLASATALGRRTLFSPQGYYYFGPLGVMSELVRVREHIVGPATSATVGTTAFQVAGSFVLGGKPGYKGVVVEHALDPEHGGFGALSLDARYHTLRAGNLAFTPGFADPDVSAQLARAFTLGMTWHLASGQKALVDYERASFRGGAPNGGNRPAEQIVVARLQASL